mgnify:CR=1 FL=1
MYKTEPIYRHTSRAKIGVLLVNLGTPSALDYFSMRRYLSQFLSDRRVVEAPPVLWRTLLQGLLLQIIPFKSRKNYAKIWNAQLDESPLLTITRAQAEKLHDTFTADQPFGGDMAVDFAMRYGEPNIADKIMRLKELGCDRLLVVPLYPQYSAVTTASVGDNVFDALKKIRWTPALRIVGAYHDHPAYIDALAHSVEKHYKELDFKPDMLLTSYHGLPVEYFKKGDPYHCHCHKTTRLLKEKLGLKNHEIGLSFQSRFGKKEWLKPYTEPTVRELAQKGVKNLAIIAPGFAADCVETLEEIEGEIRDAFMEAGGKNFTYIPCLNASPAGMDMLTALTRQNLGGWVK